MSAKGGLECQDCWHCHAWTSIVRNQGRLLRRSVADESREFAESRWAVYSLTSTRLHRTVRTGMLSVPGIPHPPSHRIAARYVHPSCYRSLELSTLEKRKRGQKPIAKWLEGRSALLVPAPRFTAIRRISPALDGRFGSQGTGSKVRAIRKP